MNWQYVQSVALPERHDTQDRTSRPLQAWIEHNERAWMDGCMGGWINGWMDGRPLTGNLREQSDLALGVCKN